MHRLCRSLLLLLVVSCLLVPSTSHAAGYNGVLKKFNAQQRTLTIYIASRKFSKDLRISSSVSVTIDGKPAKLEDVKPGDTGTVSTVGTQVTRMRIKTSAAPSKPTPRPQPMPPKPTPTPEPTPTPSPQPQGTTNAAGNPWPQLRGPQRNGHSTEAGLNWNWGPQGPKPLWSQKGLGEGYSSVSISGGKVFTMGTQGNREAVFAMNLSGGTALWGVPIGNNRNDGQGNGPRGTPTVDGDRVYALGANGDLVCLSVEEGRGLWSKNILQEFGGSNITWGISESVLIDGDKLICTPGGSRGTMVAINKENGRVLWTCQVPGNPKTSYSSAIIMEVGGVKQYVNMVHDRIIGVSAETGRLLWEDRNAVNDTANCSTPLAFSDDVFYATGYGTGGSLVSLTSSGTSTTASHKYHTRDMKNHHGGMVIVGDYLYGSSDPGVLTCLEAATGEIKWQNRAPGKGSITFAEGHLIVRNEKGPITLVKANPQRYEQVAQFQTPAEFRSNRQQWSYPVVADGKLFLRDQDVLLVYDLSR